MKQILFTALLLIGVGSVNTALAQSDDIYYNSKDAKKDAEKYTEPARESSDASRYDDGTYTRSSINDNTVRSEETEDYAEYDSDDYTYASSIRRFNNGFYGMGYWNSFYNNPFWYDPFWGPYGGFGYSPGWSVGVGYGYGFGGPYWSSYWGYNNWYGYPGFYSYYNSPYCGYGWGGYYGGFYNSYNMGYWNGYYAGAYNGFGNTGGGKPMTYGPRYSMNSIRNNNINRPYFSNNGTKITPERPNSLRTASGNNVPVRGAVANDAVRNYNENTNTVRSDRPARGSFSNSNDVRSAGGRTGYENGSAVQNTRPTRSAGQMSEGGSRWSGGGRSQGIRNSGGQSVPRSEGSGRSFGSGNSNSGRSGSSWGGSSSGGSRSSGSWGGSSGSSGGGRSFGGGSSGGGGRSFGGGGRR